ncbi:hypothetical protein F8388_001331 [Cannabis sativa]|nr:hypothetical protein F8388_001331 [Cannabis sativa]
MKAPERRQSNQIGARWLRDNMGQPVEGGAGHRTSEKASTEAMNTDRDSGDVLMMDGVVNGVIGGRRFGDFPQPVKGTNQENINGEREKNGEVDINKESQQEGIVIVDLKRRRVNGKEVLGHSSEDFVGSVVIGYDVDVGIYQEGINRESGIIANGVYDKDSGGIHVVKPNVSSSHPALVNQTVNVLMSSEDVAWDVDLVRDLFNDRDANLILSIPLSLSLEPREMPPPGFNGGPPGPFGCLGSLCHGLCRLVSS